MEVLKNCPFCGSKATFNSINYKDKTTCAVVCVNSKCRLSALYTFHVYEDMESAIEAWNTRVESEEKS